MAYQTNGKIIVANNTDESSFGYSVSGSPNGPVLGSGFVAANATAGPVEVSGYIGYDVIFHPAGAESDNIEVPGVSFPNGATATVSLNAKVE